MNSIADIVVSFFYEKQSSFTTCTYVHHVVFTFMRNLHYCECESHVESHD